MENTRQNEPKDYFLIIPAAVAQKWFNPAVLYGEIRSLSQNGPCVASDAFFAQRYHVDQRTVRNALKRLEAAGLIERKRTGSTAREITIKGEFLTGKDFPVRRKESSGHAEQDFRPEGNDLPATRKNLSKLTGKNLPNSNISLVNSLSRQALPTDQEIFEYAEQIALDRDAAEQFIRQMEADSWQIHGEPVRNWKAVLRSRLRWQNEKENGGKSENGPKQEERVGIHL